MISKHILVLCSLCMLGGAEGAVTELTAVEGPKEFFYGNDPIIVGGGTSRTIRESGVSVLVRARKIGGSTKKGNLNFQGDNSKIFVDGGIATVGGRNNQIFVRNGGKATVSGSGHTYYEAGRVETSPGDLIPSSLVTGIKLKVSRFQPVNEVMIFKPGNGPAAEATPPGTVEDPPAPPSPTKPVDLPTPAPPERLMPAERPTASVPDEPLPSPPPPKIAPPVRVLPEPEPPEPDPPAPSVTAPAIPDPPDPIPVVLPEPSIPTPPEPAPMPKVVETVPPEPSPPLVVTELPAVEMPEVRPPAPLEGSEPSGTQPDEPAVEEKPPADSRPLPELAKMEDVKPPEEAPSSLEKMVRSIVPIRSQLNLPFAEFRPPVPGEGDDPLVGEWQFTGAETTDALVRTLSPDVAGTLYLYGDGTALIDAVVTIGTLKVPRVGAFAWVSDEATVTLGAGSDGASRLERDKASDSQQVFTVREEGKPELSIIMERR